MKFRRRYRQADVLLIDDVHFFAGKERSQDEFFHTFNALFDGHKQIVMTSDRPPSEMARLEARLVSRFEWGIAAAMQPPDMETRIAILQKKMALWDVRIPDEITRFLAERIANNVRRLEGALTRVASFASLSGVAADDPAGRGTACATFSRKTPATSSRSTGSSGRWPSISMCAWRT